MDRAVVKEFARDMVAQAAPGEVPMFDSLADAYLEDPERVRRGGPLRAGPAGADLATVVMLMTPVIVYIAEAMLDLVVEQTGKTLFSRILQRLQRLRKRRRPVEDQPAAKAVPKDLVALGTEVTALGVDIRALALEAFLKHHWSRKRSEDAADIVLSLFVAGPTASDDQLMAK